MGLGALCLILVDLFEAKLFRDEADYRLQVAMIR